MMYVFSDNTLMVALDQWKKRKILDDPEKEKKISDCCREIIDFMKSDETVKNKMIVESYAATPVIKKTSVVG